MTDETELESFLAALPPGTAEELRAAAERIDALEAGVGPPGWIERHLRPLILAALALFALGLALVLLGATGRGGPALLFLAVLLLAAFPALAFAYLWSVRRRSAIDREKIALNERHFLPRGAVYYGPRAGRRMVLRVAPREDTPTLRERTERLHAEVTRRRWWW